VTIVVAAVVAFLIASYRVLTSDLDTLLEMVPDDAFYYLQIARHLATDGSSTFDGVSATNGYHPLWMAILSSLAIIVDDRTTLLRSAIALCLALHAVVAVLVFRAVRGLVDAAWGTTAATCWLINPLAFAIALTSTEAAVYALAAVMVFAVHVSLLEESAVPAFPKSGAWRYGAALGLLCLARTDGLIVALLALTWIVVSRFRNSGGVATAAQLAAVCGLTVAAIVAPWWLFSLSQVGTIVQDSGAMKILWADDAFPTALSRLENVGDTFQFFARRTLTLMTVWNYSSWTFTIAAVVLAIAPAVLLIRRPGSVEARAVRAIGVTLAALTVVYGTSFLERQIWWLTLPCLSIVLLMFIAFPAWLRSWRPEPGIEASIRVGLIALAIALFVRWHVKGHTPYPWQPDVRRSQLAIESVVPATETIGCFNAGIPAYFGSRRVVGLDGLVNHEARVAWSLRRVDEFIERHSIAYIADEDRIVERAQRFTKAPIPLKEMASYPLRGWPTGTRHLWHVSRAEP
jgi:hypothetical protein